jgi:hypothetical protein
VQAAFTTPSSASSAAERADVVVDSTDLALDDHSLGARRRGVTHQACVLQGFAARDRNASRPQTIALRFLRSVEIVGDGRVGRRHVTNELVPREDGTLAAPDGRDRRARRASCSARSVTADDPSPVCRSTTLAA